jgi:hypothetical protein
MENLTADQVNSFHKLYHFLRLLKVIGTINMKTERCDIDLRETRYKLIFLFYDPSMKGKLTPHEHLEQYFIHSQEIGGEDYTYNELQDLCRPRDSDEI